MLPIVPPYNTVGVMYDEEKIFCTGPTKAAKAEQISFVPVLYKPKEPTKEGPLSFVHFES